MPPQSGDGSGMLFGTILRTRYPEIEVAIVFGHQPFKRQNFQARELRKSRIDESTEDQVHLSGAAMPGAHTQPPDPGIDLCNLPRQLRLFRIRIKYSTSPTGG